MNSRDIVRLKNTIKPFIRDAVMGKKKILKQQTIGQRLQQKLVKDIAHQTDGLIQSARSDMGLSTLQYQFPSKNTLLQYQNQHTANKVMQKIAWQLQQELSIAVKQFGKVYQDPEYISSFFQDPLISQVMQKYKQHSKHISPDRVKFVRQVLQVKDDLKDVIKKLYTFVQRYTVYDPNQITLRDVIHSQPSMQQYVKQLIDQYKIMQKLKMISKNIYDLVNVNIQQEDDQVDFTPIVFAQHRRYPDGFKKHYSDKSILHDLVQNVILGKTNQMILRQMFADYWYEQKDWQRDFVRDKIYQKVMRSGVSDQATAEEQLKKIQNKVFKQMGIKNEDKSSKNNETTVA